MFERRRREGGESEKMREGVEKNKIMRREKGKKMKGRRLYEEKKRVDAINYLWLGAKRNRHQWQQEACLSYK